MPREPITFRKYKALDMPLGMRDPELGGEETAIDVIGLNFYPRNQLRLRGGPVPLGHHDYRPLAELLAEVYDRYRKTAVHCRGRHSARPIWLSYVAQGVRTAIAEGIPVHGICIYPVTDYRGWDNDQICRVGLFGSPAENGTRPVYRPLIEELRRQQILSGHVPHAAHRES